MAPLWPRKNGLKTSSSGTGSLQDPPIEPSSVDLVILSQALHHAETPAAAVAAAHKILRPHGQILILDLLKHGFDKARESYGDRWLGFQESDLHRWLEDAGFRKIEISVVAREEEPPHEHSWRSRKPTLTQEKLIGLKKNNVCTSARRAGNAGAAPAVGCSSQARGCCSPHATRCRRSPCQRAWEQQQSVNVIY
jgi:SAM-dependent methyltransferase